MTRLRSLSVTALLALAVGDCAVNPATGRRELMLVSEGQEIAMGREADPQIVEHFGLYPDSAVQRYVRDLGLRLAAQGERPNLPWTFRVLDDPIVNAFALPGGFNYVTRGILVYLESEAELASVMGHELGHVTARHGAAQMSQQQLFAVPLVVGSVALPRYEGLFGIAAGGLQLLFLKFSRDDEREADALGLRYMSRLGYDANEMPNVYDMLNRVSQASGGGGGGLPTWLSTHPNPEDREERIRQLIAALPQPVGRIARRPEYLRAIDGMMYGENPREGFFRDQVFYHPDLAFRIAFPSGWKTVNQRSAVLAQAPDEGALMRFRLASDDSPEAAARAFANQEGVQAGAPRPRQIGGLAASAVDFSAATESGQLAGSAVFVELQGRVYEVLGVAAASRWSGYRGAVLQSVDSFGRVTDRAILGVQPLRVQTVTLDRPMTLAQFASRYPSQVSLDAVALLNRVGRDEQLPAGRLVKRVVGGPLP
jgi:predicted Zn-dependent protease